MDRRRVSRPTREESALPESGSESESEMGGEMRSGRPAQCVKR
jgi:hypothetical protein